MGKINKILQRDELIAKLRRAVNELLFVACPNDCHTCRYKEYCDSYCEVKEEVEDEKGKIDKTILTGEWEDYYADYSDADYSAKEVKE